MLSLQRFQGVAWTLLGFMLMAAVVLNLRYKALDDGTGYLDTWTGRIRSTAGAPQADADGWEIRVPSRVAVPQPLEIVVPDPVVVRKRIEICVGEPRAPSEQHGPEARTRESWIRSELMARILSGQAQRARGSSVRFAFPAPPHVCR